MARTSAKSPRRSDLAMIHIAAKQLGLDDDTYRDMLWTVARQRSAALLDAAGRQAVLAHLRAVGWKNAPPAREASATRYDKGTPAALIRWLWTQLHEVELVHDASDRALRRYIAKHGGLGHPPTVEEIAPQHLTRREASTIIQQFKAWLQRAKPPA